MREILIQCTSSFLFGINSCCWLSVHYRTLLKIILSNLALFSTDNFKLDRILSKIKWKIHISNIKDAYIKRYEMQLPVLLFYSFYFIILSFLQLFRTSFKTMWRNLFITNFSFLTDSPPNPLYTLNGHNLLNMMKVFCWGPHYIIIMLTQL